MTTPDSTGVHSTEPAGASSPQPAGLIYQHALAYLIGLEGVALMKAFAGEFDAAFTRARLAEVRTLLDSTAIPGDGVEIPPMSAVSAYDGWARTYDSPDNGIFAIEEPVLRPMLDRLPAGVAVDAACGTGRHAAHLALSGHRVHGFDISAEMLAVAAQKVPGGEFREADVRDLPLPDSCADLVVNALALAHIEDLAPVFREAARVLRPGGHFVISDTRSHFVGSPLYPLVKCDVDDNVGYIPTWRHATSDYLQAAIPAGFAVRECQEPLRPGPIVDPSSPPEPEPIDPAYPPDVWNLHEWAAEAANATYRDESCLIVWDFELEGPR
ncbi:MAG: class I SAM-dependent methyltransferase [Nocardioidaceae bacterium]